MALAVGNPDISNELWQSTLTALEHKFSKPVFEMWIKPLRLVSLTGNELLVAVQNNFARDWVENRLKGQIGEVLTEVFGPGMQLQITVSPEAAEGSVPGSPAGTPVNGTLRPAEYRPGNLNSR